MKRNAIFIISCVAVILILGATVFCHAADLNKTDDGVFTYHLTEDGGAYSVGFNRSYTDACEEIAIPSTFRGKPVVEIEDYGFASCGKIKSVVISETVKRIGNGAFKNCAALESVTFADGASTGFIGNAAFSDCSRLGSIALPEGLGYIAYDLFYGCGSLKTVYLPQGITEIYGGAFGYCVLLEGVKIPSTVRSIGNRAFTGCRSLGDVEFCTDGGVSALTRIGGDAFYGCRSVLRIELPSGIESIGERAFAYCRELELIGFTGSALASVGGSAFLGCESLCAVDVADIGSWCSVRFLKNDYSNPIYLAQVLLCGGERVIRLEIPEGVTGIGARTFKNATEIVSVTLPSSLEGDRAIGTDAFRYCYKLVEIYNYSDVEISQSDRGSTGYIAAFVKNVYTLDGESSPAAGENFPYGEAGRVYSEDEYTEHDTHIYSVGENGEFLFYKDGDELVLLGYFGNESEIALPVTKIPYSVTDAAFFGHRDIKSVVIPSCVTEISQFAFYGCTALERVYISDGVAIAGDGIFGRTADLAVYMEADGIPEGWSTLWNGAANRLTVAYSQKKDDLAWVTDILSK